MSTLLQKRQQATLNNLVKRKTAAENHIKKQTDKLEEKLLPYRCEIEVCECMIAEHKASNPELGEQGGGAPLTSAEGTNSEVAA